MEYAIMGKEIGESGTPHIQGYFLYKNPRSWAAIRKLFRGRAHIENELKHSSPMHNKTYCSKEGDFQEWGKCPEHKQGKRSDIDKIRELVLEGTNARELWLVAGSQQAFKFGETGMRLFSGKRNWIPVVCWLYGPTGS